MDRREGVEQAAPLLATVSPNPELACRGPEVERGRFELVDVHRVALDREEAFLLRQPAGEPPPRATAVLASPDRGSAARTGARRRLERHDVDRVGVVRMHDDWEAEVGRQPLTDRSPRAAVVVAAQHAEVRVFRKAAVVLHVEPAGRILVTCDFVHALAELGIGIGHESGADALIGRREARAGVFAQVMAASRDANVHPSPVAQDRVQAEPAVPRMPHSSVRVVADARNHLPGIATVAALEE